MLFNCACVGASCSISFLIDAESGSIPILEILQIFWYKTLALSGYALLQSPDSLGVEPALAEMDM